MSSISRKSGNRIELYSIASNAADTLEHAFVQNVKTDFTQNDDGTWSIPLDQTEDSPALTTFLATYGPAPGEASSDMESVTYEDGTSETAAVTTDTSKYLYCIAYQGVVSTNRKTWQGIVVVAPGAGSWSSEYGKLNRPKIEFRSVKAPADTTCASAKYNAAMVTGADTTIDADSYGEVVWMTKGTA